MEGGRELRRGMAGGRLWDGGVEGSLWLCRGGGKGPRMVAVGRWGMHLSVC
jgi:hypothetical protein